MKKNRSGDTANELHAKADLRVEGVPNVTQTYKADHHQEIEKIADLVQAYMHDQTRFRQVAPRSFERVARVSDQRPEVRF